LTLIILPILSNAAEHATAVVVASKGKFDLAMSVAVGSCIQISLFVIPLLILIAWGLGKPLTLLFDPVETIVCVILVVSWLKIYCSAAVSFLLCPFGQVFVGGWKGSLDEWCRAYW
jgi:calcium/proton exchanger cax